VAELSEQEIRRCLADENWLRRQSPDWFVGLYDYLRAHKWATAQVVQNLPIVLTDDGRLVSTQGRIAYTSLQAIKGRKRLQQMLTHTAEVDVLHPAIVALLT